MNTSMMVSIEYYIQWVQWIYEFTTFLDDCTRTNKFDRCICGSVENGPNTERTTGFKISLNERKKLTTPQKKPPKHEHHINDLFFISVALRISLLFFVPCSVIGKLYDAWGELIMNHFWILRARARARYVCTANSIWTLCMYNIIHIISRAFSKER